MAGPNDFAKRTAMLRRQMMAAEAAAMRQEAAEPAGYKQFSATELYCQKCRRAMPVRERLLLVLPDGDLFDYSCVQCGSSLGTRKAK